MGKIMAGLLGAVGWIYSRMPSFLRYPLAYSLGSVFSLLQLRKSVICQNLEYAYPNDLALQKKLQRDSYTHLGFLVFEVLMVLGGMKSFVQRNVCVEGREHLERAKAEGKGFLFLSSHVGCWEVMAAASSILGIQTLLVTKHIKPEWLHQAIESGRERCRVQGTYEPRTMRDILKHLKKGEPVGMVMDQYAGPPIGVRVPFMGKYVGTSSGLAAIAKRTGASVIPVLNYRDRQGRFVLRFSPPIPWQNESNPNRELAVNTALYAQHIEADVRAHPEQWLWLHRRFKGDLSPVDPGEWDAKRTRKG